MHFSDQDTTQTINLPQKLFTSDSVTEKWQSPTLLCGKKGLNSRIQIQERLKTFKCKQCYFVTSMKEEFWAHNRIHIKPEKLLTCRNCPFVTEFKHHMDYHVRNHFGDKPFKCDKCDYSCVNKSMLNSHRKSHSNVYQYRCADCEYATKYLHSLKIHLRRFSHHPGMVLYPDGTPNPMPIVDIYGTRRGPKIKAISKKETKQRLDNEENVDNMLNMFQSLMVASQLVGSKNPTENPTISINESNENALRFFKFVAALSGNQYPLVASPDSPNVIPPFVDDSTLEKVHNLQKFFEQMKASSKISAETQQKINQVNSIFHNNNLPIGDLLEKNGNCAQNNFPIRSLAQFCPPIRSQNQPSVKDFALNQPSVVNFARNVNFNSFVDESKISVLNQSSRDNIDDRMIPLDLSMSDSKNQEKKIPEDFSRMSGASRRKGIAMKLDENAREVESDDELMEF